MYIYDWGRRTDWYFHGIEMFAGETRENKCLVCEAKFLGDDV
jgi:hypothetical protein